MRRWWAAIGGASAVTIWSWIVALPLAIVLGVSGGLLLALPMGPWLVAVVITQLLLIVPLVLARIALLPARQRPSRPLTALVVFALIGALRALLLALFASWLGADVTVGFAAGWMLSGAVYGIAVLAGTAIVVDGLRQHRAVMARLASLRAAVAAASDMDDARIAALEQQVLADVEVIVLDALADVQQASGQSAAAAAAAMRSAAESVIRPLSHRLAEETEHATEVVPDAPAPTRRERAAHLISAMRPAHPLAPAVVIELLGLPYLLDRTSLPFVVTNLIIGGGSLVLLSWVVARLWSRSSMRPASLVLLGLAYALIGGVAAWLSTSVSRALGIEAPFFWTTVAFFPAIALTISLLAALDTRRIELQDETATALALQANATATSRQRIRQLHPRLSRVLHSSVQGEFIASAMSISGWAQADPTTVQREVDRLSTIVTQRLHEDQSSQASIEELLDDLLGLWDGLLEVDLEITPEARSFLAQRTDLQHDAGLVIAEGLTNAVRHGQGRSVDVELAATVEGLHVCVASDGTLAQQRTQGLGSRTMDELTGEWELREFGGRVVLEALLR